MESAGKGSVVPPLLAIEREDVTGVLEFRALGIATQLFCRAGEIVFATGGTLTETLGRMLIRSGRLTEDQVAAVIRRLTDTIVDGEQVRFGEILLEYGFMSNDELEVALSQQVKEKLLGCVHRGDGEWRLTKNDRRVDEVGSYVVRTRPCLVEGMLHFPERRVESILQVDENRYPEIVAPENVVAAEFELTKGEAAVLTELDGTATMQFILSKAPSDTMAPLIAALVLGGGVDLKPTPAGVKRGDTRSIPPEFRTLRRAAPSLEETAQFAKAPVRKASVPGMPAASDPLVKAGLPPKRPSYSTLAVAVPPSQRRSSRQSLVQPTAEVLTRSREAFERLKLDLDQRKPASKRMRWPDPKDEKQSRLMAESAFHQGRMWLHAEEAERALPGLHRALELRPHEHEYELYVKWAQMLVNDTFKDDAQRTTIQALAAKLVRENRDCELGHSILGHCSHHDAHDEAALRFFQRAAQLDPKLVDAARLARLLAQRATTDGKPRPGSRPEIRTARRDRGALDAAIDEIVPGIATRPILTRAPGETPSPRATGAGRKQEDGVPPTSGRTWDGIGAPAPPPVAPGAPPRVLAPPVPRRHTPSPITAVAPPVTEPMPDIPPPPDSDSPVPHTAIMAPIATPAAPPPVAPLAPAPAAPVVAAPGPTPAPAGLAIPSIPPPALGLPPLQLQPPSTPLASSASIPSIQGPWHVTPSPPQPSLPPPGASLAPPPNPFANGGGGGHESARIPLDPSSAREASAAETVMIRKKSKAGLIIGLVLTLCVTGGLAFVVGTKVLGPKEGPSTARSSDPHDTTTTTTAITPPSSATPPVSVAAVPPPAPAPAPAPDPEPAVTASAKVTLSKPPKTMGTVRVKRSGWGHRVFIDGQVAGQGGKDITWQCGPHRVKVGSAGRESSVDIPCGGTVEVD